MSLVFCKSELGFTLIELLVTVAIVGLLAAIAIPQYTEFKKQAYGAELLSAEHDLITALELIASDNYDTHNISIGCIDFNTDPSSCGYIKYTPHGVDTTFDPIEFTKLIPGISSNSDIFLTLVANAHGLGVAAEYYLWHCKTGYGYFREYYSNDSAYRHDVFSPVCD